MVDAPSDRPAEADAADPGERREHLLVVNTAEGVRTVRIELVRAGAGRTATRELEPGGHASAGAPDGPGMLAVTVEARGQVADAVVRRPPMAVVRERSIELC